MAPLKLKNIATNCYRHIKYTLEGYNKIFTDGYVNLLTNECATDIYHAVVFDLNLKVSIQFKFNI